MESGRLDTLFRGNSVACKVLSSCFKTFGLYYLQSVVRPLILSLIKSCDREYEVDPSRLEDRSKLTSNQNNVLELIESFYSTILSSLPSLPLQIRTVCHVLYSVRMPLATPTHVMTLFAPPTQVVFSYFPESSIDTVNSAIFLRFINPAIGKRFILSHTHITSSITPPNSTVTFSSSCHAFPPPQYPLRPITSYRERSNQRSGEA